MSLIYIRIISLIFFSLLVLVMHRVRAFHIPLFLAKFKLQRSKNIRFSTMMKSVTIHEKKSKYDKRASTPFILNAIIDEDIVKKLKLATLGSRKGRILISKQHESITLEFLNELILKRFPKLVSYPFKLSYSLPGVLCRPKRFQNDDELVSILKENEENQKTIQLFVQPVNEAMDQYPDPLESNSFSFLSFYKFHNISDIEAFIKDLRALWKPFHALGRVYVATEGVNAQMAVPTNVLEQFINTTKGLDIFKETIINIDHSMSADEYYESWPFTNLHIRARNQVLSDGLESSLDWNRAGHEMDPLSWHKALVDNPNSIILDCRNVYESNVGKFENAVPLNTTSFRDSWPVLEEVLKDTPKDAPIMTYCTGGIRCVKINAYLEQKMGFHNTHRLKGGIISYTREIRQQRSHQKNEKDSQLNGIEPSGFSGIQEPAEPHGMGFVPCGNLSSFSHDSDVCNESKFKGLNFVFDGRISTRVTDNVLSCCDLCGEPCDSFNNCKNQNCDIRLTQCAKCMASYSGCCSQSCQHELLLSRQPSGHVKHKTKNSLKHGESPPSRRNSTTSANVIDDLTAGPSQEAEEPGSYKKHAFSSPEDNWLDRYADVFSDPEPALLEELRKETEAHFFERESRMVSGASQGRLLTLLTRLTGAKRILELGTFTGYSAMSFAMGLPAEDPSSCVFTCEKESRYIDFATKYFNQFDRKNKIQSVQGTAMEILTNLHDNEETPFDIAFIDADKKNYLNYIKLLIGEPIEKEDASIYQPVRPLIKNNGLIIVDNTLWKGLVLSQWDNEGLIDEGPGELQRQLPRPGEFGNPKNMIRYAKIMHNFNRFVRDHPKLSNTLLPLRDGLSIIQYREGGLPPKVVNADHTQ